MSAIRDTSALDMSYAVKLANRHYTVDGIQAAIASKPSGKRHPGSLKYMRLLDTKGKDAADRYARRTAESALEFVAKNPMIRDRSSAVERLLEIESTASALPWTIYAGAGVRRTLEGAFVIADRVGGLSFGLALREWAQIAGQDFEAIRVNRDTLTDLGWLRRNPNDRAGRTSRFSLRIPSHIHSHQGEVNVGISLDRRWLHHDAFRPAAFGDMGWLLLHMLAAPTENRALALRAGLDHETLMEHLLRLERFDLIDVDDEVSRRRDTLIPALDAAARRMETSGVGETDSLRFAGERMDWRTRGPEQDVNVGALS